MRWQRCQLGEVSEHARFQRCDRIFIKGIGLGRCGAVCSALWALHCSRYADDVRSENASDDMDVGGGALGNAFRDGGTANFVRPENASGSRDTVEL